MRPARKSFRDHERRPRHRGARVRHQMLRDVICAMRSRSALAARRSAIPIWAPRLSAQAYFAAMEAPELLVGDIRAFFRGLR